MSKIDLKWMGEQASNKIKVRLGLNLKDAVTHVAERTRAQLPRQTGALAESVGVKGRGLQAWWGSDLEYASDVEFGTRERAPDGTWRRVLEQEKKTMVDIIKKGDE